MALRLRWVVVCLSVFFARSALASSPCDAVAAHRDETVIAFTPPSSFAICYGGTEETDVVTGRRVFVQLVATPGSGMFRFRIHGQATEPKVTGLAEMRTETRAVADALDELSHSSEHIASMSGGGDASALGIARARYLGVVTRSFAESLLASRRGMHDLKEAVRLLDRWCRELPASAHDSTDFAETCRSAAALRDVPTSVEHFDRAVDAFKSARDLAREALVRAEASSQDAAAASDAARLLDLARGTATTIVSDATELAAVAHTTSHDLRALRNALGTLGALRPGVPVYLATYGETGNAILRIDTLPVGVDAGDRTDEETNASFRFPVVGRHYFDVEVGAGVTGGLPQIPSISTSGSAPTIDGKDVDQFLALALVELEPLRFGWVDKPLAGILRLPVIGIPLSRDPTENFFVGAGIGWTGIGSIVGGPYFLRELTLNPGHSVGDALPAGTSLKAITTPGVNVGFFVSASIDLVGLYHLFFHEHEPTLDAATGRVQ